ncbi:glycosyltransferase family 2 protein [Blautia argi]|uniref:glycosyltransferase family 2 protein n=1 Tax=Blautia argi TaxID=1912897 RepID=UPI002943E7AF|nr:glycosyltransferase family 2 protein [Blautia argi]
MYNVKENKNIDIEKIQDKNPLVSVIISTYNVEKYVKQCVDSLINQTYKNIEIICVDGGSTDNTISILEFLKRKDGRITLIVGEKLNTAAARNRGLEVAKGKYISFVDADDFMELDSYQTLVEIAEKRNIDLVIYGANIIGIAPEWIIKKTNTHKKFYNKETVQTLIFEEESVRPFLWLHFIKRKLFEQGSKIRFNEELEVGEEQLCQFEYIPRAKTAMVIEDKLYNYRSERENSRTKLYEKEYIKKFENYLKLGCNVIEVWKREGLFDKNEDRIVTWFIGLTYWELIFFPNAIQPQWAKKIVEVIEKYELKDYCIEWYEREHLEYIKEMAGKLDLKKEPMNLSEMQYRNLGTKPMVSVIIPVYNVELYIKQCIDSLLTQTYGNIEIICIDDGSTDKTLEILEFLEKKDSRLVVIKQEHLGVSAARNKGLDIARGKYISFVDSDDFIQWNSYEILVQVAEKENLDLVIFGANVVGEAPEWIWNKMNTKYRYYRKGEAKNVIFEEESARPFLWLHFIKRDLFEKNGKIRFNEKMEMGEDQLCQFEYVPKAETVMVIEDKLYNYRVGRNCSLMQLYEKQQMKKFDSHILLVSNVVEVWKKNGLLETNEDQIITWFVNLTYWSLIYFPKAFQPDLAKKVIDVIEKYHLKDYCIAWYEKEHLDYIREMATKKISMEEEIAELEAQIKQEKYEIEETLKSKAFKLGRRMTNKQERIDLSNYLE